MNNIEKIINKYFHISDVAKWKVILLKYGIGNFYKKQEFGNFSKNYRTKYAIKNPKAINYQVYDFSRDEKIIPSEIIIKDSLGNSSLAKLRYDSKSLIKLIYDHNEKKFNLFLLKNKVPLEIRLVKKKGDQVVSFVGEDRMSIILFDGCWNWNIGKPCFFCDLNPKRRNYHNLIPELNSLVDFKIDYKKWWQSQKNDYFKNVRLSLKKYFNDASPHKHLLIMSGGFVDNEYLWLMIKETLVNINKAIPLNSFDNYLNVPPPTNNHKKTLREIKSLGIKQVQFNLEVIGENNFKTVCPGKSESIGYDNFIESLIQSSKIFGPGRSRTNFVLSKNQSSDLIKEANRLAKYGIVSDYSIFQPKKGTKWQNKKTPEIEEIINFTIKLAEVYKKYNFNGIYCSLSSRSSIINEILQPNVY